jgi:hypothetical protein
MIAAMYDWASSLTRHGFDRIYWFNGHGGNIAPINSAFSEIYSEFSFGRAGSNRRPIRLFLRNWWELPGVGDLCRELFPVGEGSHATASEVSVTYFAYPDAQKQVEMHPKIAPLGSIRDADDYRRQFPDGRIGSDPSQATPEKGKSRDAGLDRRLQRVPPGGLDPNETIAFVVSETRERLAQTRSTDAHAVIDAKARAVRRADQQRPVMVQETVRKRLERRSLMRT